MANSHSTNTMLRSRLNAGPQKAASGLPSSVLWVVCCVKVQPRESGAPLVSLRLLVAEEDFFFFFFLHNGPLACQPMFRGSWLYFFKSTQNGLVTAE